MKVFNWIFVFLFVLFAALQYNDPDPYVWMPIYLYAAALCWLATRVKFPRPAYLTGFVVYGVYAVYKAFDKNGLVDWARFHNAENIAGTMKAETPWVEETREFFGLVIVIVVLAFNYRWLSRRKVREAIKSIVSIALVLFFVPADAQLGVRYDPAVQSTGSMQYFKPKGDLFVGDCIPFSKDGVYYYYWLLDSAHHKSLNGLGGHQWALSKSSDLKHWVQFPLVLGIDEAWEKSICTGSVVFHNGKYYAFYATRLVNDGKVNEQLSYAISIDGVHFEKQKPNPFYTSAPGYSKRNFRDPKVFVDKEGVFHLFVSSNQEKPVMSVASGCLVHLTSKDLQTWTVLDPILTGQGSTPECPDYFFWKGWYYLIYSDNSNTFYLKSKQPYGPWQEPRYQALNEDWANVVKTAGFKNDRRIAAAWVPSRSGETDDSGEIFGGNSLFREVIQEPDGTLDTRFPEEMIPGTGDPISIRIEPGHKADVSGIGSVTLNESGGLASARIAGVPQNCRISLQIQPVGSNEEFGLLLKSDSDASVGYRLNFSAQNRIVSLANTRIQGVEGLDKTITLDLLIKDGILDADIDHRRTIVNRTYALRGSNVWLYAKHGKVIFSSISVRPLLAE